MSYAKDRIIHDADSHIMELPERITEFMESKYVEDFKPCIRPKDPEWLKEIQALHDDAAFRGLTAKAYQ